MGKRKKIMVGNIEVRNGFEAKLAQYLISESISFTYEEIKIPFITKSNYLVDFAADKIGGGLMIIETKGLFDAEDRRKHLNIKKQHPEWDIRILFYNASKRIGKRQNSKTYGEWCTYHGIPWANKTLPKEWRKEMAYV